MASSLERQRHQADTIALAPSDVPTVEIAWRDGPTSHRAADHVSPDPRIRIVSGADSPEMPVAELKRYGGSSVAEEKPSLGRRMIRAVGRFCIAVLIGVGATLAWQSYGDQASEIIKAWAAPLTQRLAGSATNSAPEVTLAGTQTALPVQAAAQDVALPGQAVGAAASMQQLDAIARNVTMLQKGIEQLSAKQEEMARTIATLQAAEQDIKAKLSPVSQSKVVVPLPPRKRTVADGPAQLPAPPSAEPSPSPRATPVARPPMSLDPPR